MCMRCGMCQGVCPLFAETGLESDVARGKLALLDGLMKKMFENPKGVNDRLNKCLLCGSCSANCPSGVNVIEIFLKARAILTGFMGLSAAKKMILRGMLAHPERFDHLMEWGAKFQHIFTRPVDDLTGTSCSRFVSPLGDRHFKALSDTPFHRSIPALDTAPGSSGIKIAFFVGCLIDKIFPHIGQAALEVFNHHGVGVYIARDEGCCGIPALSSGDTATFNKLVRHNLERFDPEKFDYLVTACATCTSTIKNLWPKMANQDSDDIRKKIALIAEKTLDINQFMVTQLKLERAADDSSRNPQILTYHDPCHLKKSLGVSSEPRQLIQANPDYCLKEMSESDRCCGMGGSFNLLYYGLSSSIGKRKRDSISATGASVVATGCPACMLQISDMLSQAGDRIAVKHPIEIYAEMLKHHDTVSESN
ncbi:MAG: (Fe-S)-binding protein [Desulfobacterales bacterium]|nr:(Fe-S)-binding protein [Desulfobacterales bacterium]